LGCRSFSSNADGRNLSTKAGLTTFAFGDVFESLCYWENITGKKWTKNSSFAIITILYCLASKKKQTRNRLTNQQSTSTLASSQNHSKG